MQQYDSVIRPSEMTCTVTIRGPHRSQKPCGVKSQDSNCLKNSMIPVFALFQSYRQDRYVASQEAGYLWSRRTPESADSDFGSIGSRSNC